MLQKYSSTGDSGNLKVAGCELPFTCIDLFYLHLTKILIVQSNYYIRYKYPIHIYLYLNRESRPHSAHKYFIKCYDILKLATCHVNPGMRIAHYTDHFVPVIILKLTFTAEGRHYVLWLLAITIEKSRLGYLWPEATTVCCVLRPQNLIVRELG